MKKQIKKNINQRHFFNQQEKQRLILKSLTHNLHLSQDLRWKIQKKFLPLTANSSVTRIKNVCILTGRPRSIYRFFKLSRIQLRKLASEGRLPGLSKASW